MASWSVAVSAFWAIAFSVLCLVFMNPILCTLGASENTITYARQYMFFVVVIGALPTVLSNTMSSMLRNVGYSKEAAFGIGMGGVLNVILDPIFMFVIMPESKKSLFSVGLPAACSLLLYDLTNMVINMLSSSHGDLELAAMGIILKVERLPLNIGIGICLGMTPLVAYNYAAKNKKRMQAFFKAARTSGLIVAAISLVLYRFGAPVIMEVFISDAETVRLGTAFLQARCFAPPFMFLSFHMVHFMQAVDEGKISFYLAVIRQLCLNIPILFLLNAIFGMDGIIWTQVIADILNVIALYVIYAKVMKKSKFAFT